jgi:large subunit ribosomal protein L1
VTKDITTAVNNAKSGQVQFRTEKGGIIHCAIGKVSFSVEDLNENLEALISDLLKAKPSSAKGQYITRVSLSSTMGPGVKVERSSLPL